MNIDEAAERARKLWGAEIESVSVDGWTRRARPRESYSSASGYIELGMYLDPLSLGAEEDEDFGGKRYSRWAFQAGRIWEDRLRGIGEIQWNSNWTRVWVPGGKRMADAEWEYKTFSCWMMVRADLWLASERSRKLRDIGI